jgi:uncharacterized membrane protein
VTVLIGIAKALALIYIFFIPGFAWSFVLFSRDQMDWLERGVISIALSIGAVVLSVFWLNWLLDVRISLLNCLVVAALTILALASLALKTPSARKRLRNRLRGGSEIAPKGQD